MRDPRKAIVLEGARTPFSKAWGELQSIGAVELGRVALVEAMARSEGSLDFT